MILPTPEGNELVKGLSCDNEIVPMWCAIYIWCDKDAANMHKQWKSHGDWPVIIKVHEVAHTRPRLFE